MSKRTSEQTFSRRQLLASAATTTAVAATTGAAAAQDNTTDGTATDETATNETASGEAGGESVEYDFGGYLDDANLYDGTDSVEDLRGESSVTVEVGAGSGFAFSPPAIHVDPGTAVTWEWTGEGGAHNVVANDETFDSGSTQQSGTYEYTFEEDATHTYYCVPHEGAGMKGAVVVGSGGSSGGNSDSAPETAANDLALQTLAVMLVLGLLSPLIFLLFVRRKMQGPPRPE
jgi:halocyanin-like protein